MLNAAVLVLTIHPLQNGITQLYLLELPQEIDIVHVLKVFSGYLFQMKFISISIFFFQGRGDGNMTSSYLFSGTQPSVYIIMDITTCTHMTSEIVGKTSRHHGHHPQCRLSECHRGLQGLLKGILSDLQVRKLVIPGNVLTLWQLMLVDHQHPTIQEKEEIFKSTTG